MQASLLRYFGAKNRLAEWIISHFPKHTCYVEPFGGSAGVLLRKEPSTIEVYNDVDDDVVEVFRLIRGGRAEELARLVLATPFSLTEYRRAMEPAEEPLERARRFFIRSFMAVSTDGTCRTSSGFRRSKVRSGHGVAQRWDGVPEIIAEAADRLKNVQIDHLDALDCMRLYDNPETLHYVDPPYLEETRTTSGRYAHEYTREQHVALLELLPTLKGHVVLSCYDSELYRERLSDWHRVTHKAHSMRQAEREEVLYISNDFQPVLI